MYVRHTFRQRQISTFNASLNITSGTTLLSLPDDLLLIILDIVEHNQADKPHDTLSYTGYRSRRKEQDLLHLSMAHRHFRTLIAPRLFRKMTIGHEYGHWTGDELIASFELLSGSLLAQSVSEVDPFIVCPQTWNRHSNPRKSSERGMIGHAFAAWYNISDDIYAYWVATFEGGVRAKQTRQLETLGVLAAEVLPNMPRLSTLSVDMMPIDVAIFRKAMQSRSPILRTVTSLKITPHVDFLVSLCPNLLSLDIGHGFQPPRSVHYGSR